MVEEVDVVDVEVGTGLPGRTTTDTEVAPGAARTVREELPGGDVTRPPVTSTW